MGISGFFIIYYDSKQLSGKSSPIVHLFWGSHDNSLSSVFFDWSEKDIHFNFSKRLLVKMFFRTDQFFIDPLVVKKVRENSPSSEKTLVR